MSAKYCMDESTSVTLNKKCKRVEAQLKHVIKKKKLAYFIKHKSIFEIIMGNLA